MAELTNREEVATIRVALAKVPRLRLRNAPDGGPPKPPRIILHPDVSDGLAALDRLAAECVRITEQRNEAIYKSSGDYNRIVQQEYDREVSLRKAAEAEVARYRTTLEAIANTATDLPHARRIDREEMRELARAALAGENTP